MKTWVLLTYILSFGFYQETHLSAKDCQAAMIEAQLVRGPDLWTATCIGPEDEIIEQISRELSP